MKLAILLVVTGALLIAVPVYKGMVVESDGPVNQSCISTEDNR